MRIAYDAKRAFQNSTGLGNYSRMLIRAMAGHYPDNRYFLYTPGKKHIDAAAFLLQHPDLSIRMPGGAFLPAAYWRSKGIINDLKRDNIDLYHGLSHEIPIGIQQTGIKSVVTIHDLIFLHYPKLYPAIDRWIYRAKVKNACINADHIIAISQNTKKDILHYFDVPAEKISVIYQDCHPAFYEQPDPEALGQVKKELQLPEQFLLYVGTLEERKNALLLLQALPLLPAEIKLVLLGKSTAYVARLQDFIAKYQLNDRVVFLKNIQQNQLPLLYRLARIFLYPSRYEGFGIPVLEALNSGTPVIAASGSSLEEAGGPGSVYVHPDDEQALAAAIRELWFNSDRRDEMAEQGRAYALQFREDVIAADTNRLYTKMMKGV